MNHVISHLAEHHGIHLNKQQQTAVCTDAAHVLLLAVPGSGKTTVMTAHIAYLLEEQHARPDQILTLTFSRETARDMNARYEKLFGENKALSFSTIHSFCFRVLRRFAAQYDRTVPTLIGAGEGTSAQKYQVLRETIRRCTGEFPDEEMIGEIERVIGCVKNRMISPETVQFAPVEPEVFARIYEEVQRVYKENGWMDFDDMLVLCHDILKRFPSICCWFQQKYRVICVDEAQDTSLLQHEIIRILTNGGAKLFLVGDEDQSIYSFRGASPKELLGFQTVYPDAVILKMEENHRSNSDIVAIADAFIKQNSARYEKHMVTRNQDTDSVRVISLSDYDLQYETILSIIQEKHPDETLAVLYKNNESCIALVDLFLRQGISYRCRESNAAFFHSTVVRDILAFFRLAVDPCDIDAFSQIYYKMGCSKVMLEAAKHDTARGQTVFDSILSLSSVSKGRRRMLLRYQTVLSKLPLMRCGEAIDAIRTKLGYDDFIAKRMSGFMQISTYQKLSALSLIAERLRSIFELSRRLSELEAFMQEGASDDTSGVLLSTIHSCKGMEFDTVILLDMLSDVLPSYHAVSLKREGDMSEYEDEVRLFYVAMTRAKRKLIAFMSTRLNGADAAPSPFVKALLPQKPKQTGRAEVKTMVRGTEIVHKTFGKGTVLDENDGIIFVQFECGIKRLSVSACTERNLLI